WNLLTGQGGLLFRDAVCWQVRRRLRWGRRRRELLLRRRRGRLDRLLRHRDRRGLGGLIRCGVLRRLGDGGLLGGWRFALRFLGGRLLSRLGLGRELEGRIGAAVGGEVGIAVELARLEQLAVVVGHQLA